MLELCDRIELADDVTLEGAELVDRAIGARHPANPAACTLLATQGSLAAAAAGLVEAYGIPEGRARDDALAFAWQLNQAHLANVRRGRGAIRRLGGWLGLALRGVPTGTVPPLAARRAALPSARPLRCALACARMLALRGLVVSALVCVAALQLSLVAGRPVVVPALALGSAAGVGLVAHEVGHALALVGRPAALVTHGPRTFLLHAESAGARRAVVALAGPAVPCACGILLATAAHWLVLPLAALAACPLAGHALSLAAVCSDGRMLCER